SDAIAWVLGEQGPRALRGGIMADVIFAGSPKRQALGMAEVTLVIDNSAGLIPVPASEIEISRTIYRAGESEYRLGGRPCRLLDIQELLSDTGMGRALHTIIGQGHLDDVPQARRAEARARLAGLDREIAELDARVAAAEARRGEAEDRQVAAQLAKSAAEEHLRTAIRREARARERLQAGANRSGRLFALEDELHRTEAALAGVRSNLERREAELETAEAVFRRKEQARRDAEDERRRGGEDAATRRAESEALRL